MIREKMDMPAQGTSLFFIGIGGVSMRALATLAKRRGYRVGGSDRVDSPALSMLRAEGIEVFVGHRAENVAGYDAIVYNAAIHPDNPEFAESVRLGLAHYYRTDFMAALLGDCPCAIGVAGMHGKSTASAMLSHLFLAADRDPTVLIGGELAEIGGTFRFGEGDDTVFEACEYQDSFLALRPTVAVVLNVEMDHPDYFHSMEQVRASFHSYLSIPGEGGYAVINADSPDAVLAAEGIPTPLVTFGLNDAKADYSARDIRAENGCYSCTVLKHGEALCDVRLSIPGLHHVYNALACAAAADLCGIAPDVIGRGISSFGGIARRMEYKGTFRGSDVPVYDDFAHHPTEIRTTLAGAAQMGFERVFCVYQPHTYSRTAELFDGFTKAFENVYQTVFVDIYAARETDTLGVSSEKLAQATENALYLPDYDAVTEYLDRNLRKGDLLVIMGAGDIGKYADRIVADKSDPNV